MNGQSKRTSKVLIVVLVILAVLAVVLPIIISLLGLFFIPKMIGSLEEKVGFANYSVENLRLYIPRNWKLNDKYYISTSGNCRVFAGTVRFDQDRMERILGDDELEHKNITVNDIDMSYGFKDNGNERFYSYFFEDNGKKYFMFFINKDNSDEECDSYIEKFEGSIVLNSDNGNEKSYSESHDSGVTVHFPSTWVAGTDYYSNSDGSCSASMKMTTRDVERIKQELIPYEMEYSDRIINNINMQYGYNETDDEMIHVYIFGHPTIEKNYYLIFKQNKNSTVSDCGEFIDQIESRIVIDY